MDDLFMSFGENLQFLRRQKGITQEELAERLAVSRQSVSKWESGGSFPEMEKILQLCELFSCNMDDLVRGNLETGFCDEGKSYDRHMNRFTAAICTGVGLVLLGVTLLLVLYGAGLSEILGTVVMMCFIVLGVMTLVIGGIRHGDFVKTHPSIRTSYDAERVRRFDRRFPFLIAAAIAMIFAGIIWVIASEAVSMPAGFDPDRWASLTVSPLLLLITAAAPVFIYAGIQKAKYNVQEYNRQNNLAADPEQKKKEELNGKICGCIMLVATILFLLGGFLWDLWNICWVTFPVGGILCAITGIVLGPPQP